VSLRFSHDRAGRRHTACLACVAFSLLVPCAAAPARAQPSSSPAISSAAIAAGRTIADVLRELQAKGVKVVFSSELVTPELRVRATPRAERPRALIAEILAPHRLAVREGPGGLLLIVRAPSAPGASTAGATAGPAPAHGTPRSAVAAPRQAESDAAADHTLPRVEEHVDVPGASLRAVDAPTLKSLDARQVIDAAGSFEDPLHALQSLPGIAPVNDREGRLVIRGSEAEHTMILMDGVPVRNPYRFGYLPTTVFNPRTLARVSVDASGLDAGTSGLASSIQVDTRDGDSARAMGRSGAVSLYNSDLLFEGRLPGARAGTWWFGARGTYYDLISQRGSRPAFTDLQFKIALQPTERTRLSVLGLSGFGTTHRPGAGGMGERFDSRNDIGVATLQWAPNERVATQTSVSVYSDRTELNDILGVVANPFHRRGEIADVNVRQSVTARLWRRQTVEAGLEARRLDTSFQMSGQREPQWPQSVGPNVWGQNILYLNGPVNSRLKKTEMGAWVQDRIRVTRSLDVRPGVRVEWNSFTGETVTLPRLFVAQQFGTRTRVWGGIGWQAQTPGYEWLPQGIAAYDLTAPGADVRNQRARQAVIGVEHYFFPTLVGRVEAYNRRLERLLVQRLETPAEYVYRLNRYEFPWGFPRDNPILERQPTLTPESTGRGRAKGVEMLLQHDGRRVSGRMSYTWSQAVREIYDRLIPFDFDRPHTLSLSADVSLTPRLRLGGAWRFASGSPFTPAIAEVDFMQDIEDLDHDSDRKEWRTWRKRNGQLYVSSTADVPRRRDLRNTARLEPYSRLDLRLTFSTAERLECYGEVINALGRENSYLPALGPAASDPAHGGYGMLPSFGVRVKF